MKVIINNNGNFEYVDGGDGDGCGQLCSVFGHLHFSLHVLPFSQPPIIGGANVNSINIGVLERVMLALLLIPLFSPNNFPPLPITLRNYTIVCFFCIRIIFMWFSTFNLPFINR